MERMRRGRGLAGLAAGVSALAPAAHAADLTLAIPEQPREAALIALGRQARVSLGFTPDARCGGAAGVSGRMSLDVALDRLLAGSACMAVRPDARTVVIRARPESQGPSPRPPAPMLATRPAVLGELVVTASKTEALLSASPYGLTAASGEDLERRGVDDVHDLSLIAAGVTVTNLGPGRDKVLLRGLSDGPLTGHTQSTVGLYLGDLRLTYNAPDPDLPLVDVERVEVLRGPQGSLYGSGSIGGVLQVVPNAPNPDARLGHVEAGATTTASGAPSYRGEVVYNQPVFRGAALRVAAWSEVSGGYIDNVALNLQDIDRTRRSGARLEGRWRATPELTLDAALVVQSIATRDAHYADADVGEMERATTVREPHDNDFTAIQLAARWSPSWGRLTLSLGALDHDVSTTYDATAAPMSLVAPGAHPMKYIDGNEIRGLVAEARLTSVGTGRFHWTIGGFEADGYQKLDGAVVPFEPLSAYVETRRDTLLERALFGEVSYDLQDDFTITLGGRLFGSRLKTKSDITIGPPVRSFTGNTHYQGFAPKVLIAWRPRPEVTFYAQAAEGYRTPGFNTAGPPGQMFSDVGGEQPLRRYGGDELWSFEGGLRWRDPARHVALRAAMFQADWSDIQADLVLPSGLPFTANLGDGRSRGFELEASYALGGVTLGGNVVYQDAELLKSAPGLPERPDTGLPGVPDLSFALFADYLRPLTNDWSLDLASSFTFVGRSHLAFDAVTTPIMGGYGDLRISASAASRDVIVRLFVDNLLDRRGDTLAFGNPFTYRTMRQTTPQRPRTFGVSLQRSF